MPTPNSHNDLTVRGGQPNVPAPTVHHLPPRHRPNTPVRKLRAPPVAKPDPPQPSAAEPPVLPEKEPEAVSEQ